jgi:regulator of sigma E protease
LNDPPNLAFTILSFLLVIGSLIFIHELGHYFVGRWCGVKADSFSIGFGRELAGWTDKRGTRWKIGWLPLGGYVKFKGDMNPAGQPSPEWLALPAAERAETFQAKPLWQRFLIVAAGPLTNFLFAIIVFACFFAIYGEYRTPPVVASVMPNSAASEAHLRPGDTILTVAGRRTPYFEDIAQTISIRPGELVEIRLLRDGRPMRVAAVPTIEVERDAFGNQANRGILGIAPAAAVLKPLSILEVPGAALRQTGTDLVRMVDVLGQIVTGRRSVKELGGPLKVAQFTGERASLGWLALIDFMTGISINLGFINLLPIPMLDGGHLFFYLVEGVRRKPLKPETQEWAFRTGLVALLALMLFVTLNDLASFGLWTKLGGLIG